MSEPTLQIRPATLVDLPAIAALARVIWHADYPTIISPAQIEFMLDWMYAPDTLRNELEHQGIRFERLLHGSELAGFASYGPTGVPGVFKLHKLYVHPDHQGRGCGRQLLAHTEREVVRQGANRLILAVNKRNGRAIHTYERNGYAIMESVVTDIGGGFVMDDFIMAKELRP